jgi:hypothetical protein
MHGLTKAQCDVLAPIILENLSDHLPNRRLALETLRDVMPLTHPQLHDVKMLLCYLDQHEILQRELPLMFAAAQKGEMK